MTYVPPGSQVTVQIGRNRGSEAMSECDWHRFTFTVRTALQDALGVVSSELFTGTGEWKGVKEESAMIALYDTQYPAEIEHIDVMLTGIAHMFGAEAIAWTYGPNLLARTTIEYAA